MIPVVVSHIKKKGPKGAYDFDDGDDLIRILEEQRPWQSLSFSEKKQYFDFWFIAVLIGNIC